MGRRGKKKISSTSRLFLWSQLVIPGPVEQARASRFMKKGILPGRLSLSWGRKRKGEEGGESERRVVRRRLLCLDNGGGCF